MLSLWRKQEHTTEMANANAQGLKRPTGITITAWLWIVSGGLMALSGLMAGLAFSFMRQMGPPPTVPADADPGFQILAVIFDHFEILLALQMVAAALAIWSGIALLKLKAWARTAIEVLSWLALVYCIGLGIFQVYLWISMTGQAPRAGAPIDMDLFQFAGAAIAVVVIAVFAVPLWIMIRYLRGAEVHAAIARTQETDA